MACSLLLAKAGLKVRVLEKRIELEGGTKNSRTRWFRFDNGPTFFHFPEVIEEIFQAIGKDAHEELGLIPLDPSYRLVFGKGGAIDATSDLEAMTKQIRELCGDKDAEGFKRYMYGKQEEIGSF